jgi:hypothetical protein
MLTKPSSDRGWLEPESPANDETPPKYPYNRIQQTPSGHSFEMDDTPQRERVRLQHRTGTFIEMHPNGDEVHKVYGDGYEITIKDKNVLIEGHCSITINGDSIINVKGDKIEKVEGDYRLEVLGDMTTYCHKNAAIASDRNTTIGAGSAAGTGSIRLATGGTVYVSGDMSVGGDVTADLITSATRVDAGTGVSAGPLGFVSVLGGLTIGPPGVAVPGNINCVGLINAGLSVNAPAGNFGIMTAGLMTDQVNSKIYSRHFHIAPKGRTGPPIVSMI